MYTIRTLQRKASAAGYLLRYGYQRNTQGSIISKKRGFSLIHGSTNGIVLGSDSLGYNTASRAEVEEFLREVYKTEGMKF